ncbi:NAD(+) diphosphatase [Kineococcus siccus]|uniref:NAD(+) diphosphatase n=1 Tax=Kineococcus siccus TaxID=2696567 RepID=UPI00196B5AE0
MTPRPADHAHPADARPADRSAVELARGPLPGLALAGPSTLDRAGVRRTTPGLLDALWADPATRVLRVHSGRAPVVPRRGGFELVLLPPAGVPAPGPDDLTLYLGTAGGTEHVAVVSAESEPEVADGSAGDEEWRGLREVGTVLPPLDARLFTEALAMGNWHAVTRFSPRTGEPLTTTTGGWVKAEPAGREHFPRTDAAVIMAVVDPEDRLLLGHQPIWPANRYSILAGFVEPGESFEDTVRREVFEEAGVVVGPGTDDVRYLGSQPWPFPASIMVGFTARAVTTDIRVDGDEIALARWFSRAELAEAVTTGSVLPPPPVSISRKLIEAWFGGPLPVPDDEPWA